MTTLRPALSRRVALLGAALLVVAVVVASSALHERLVGLIARVGPVAALHPVLGPVLFVGLATLSAMVVFVSSVVLVPIGVAAWGTAGCLALLWTGWLIGGVVTYTVGRTLGRRFVERIVPADKLAEYERRIPAGRSFWTALVIQMALQSDVAGYLFGILQFPAPTYLAALMTSELIVALGTVFAGEAFLSGRWTVLLALAVVAAGGMLWRRRRAARS